MRSYEVMFILRPDMPEDEADKLIATLEGVASQAGANAAKTERMGKRRLAYRVRGFREGQYVLFTLEEPDKPGLAPIQELQRRLRVSEPVIKFLVVRTDELERRFQKDRRRREARAQRKPAPAPAPAVPGAAEFEAQTPASEA